MNETPKAPSVNPLKEIADILAAGIVRMKRKGKQK